MIIDRKVFQAKYGKANELVSLLKRGGEAFKRLGYDPGRVLTDLSGAFFTVVWENEWESLAHWDEARQKMFADPEFGRWFAEMETLVESGSREFYAVE